MTTPPKPLPPSARETMRALAEMAEVPDWAILDDGWVMLRERGFVELYDWSFVRLTDAGRAALAQMEDEG